jgi:prevent-host-death family protein
MKVNIHEVKARLSEYLEAVERGERVVICRRNRPVAELVPVGTVRTTARPLGGLRGRIDVPPTFFEPLPDDLLDTFYAGAAPPSRDVPPVAERAARPFGSTPEPRKGRARR